MSIRSVEYLQSLVRELVKLPNETEWVEFKCNNKEPQMIGEYISALSNSAALCERPKAYLVWGVQDDTHKITGTEFQYRKMKKGNEELEAWLSRMLAPRINFRFFESDGGGKLYFLKFHVRKTAGCNFCRSRIYTHWNE